MVYNNFKFEVCLCFIWLSLFFIVFTASDMFITLEIYYAIKYGDDITCDDGIDISIKNWLLINSISTIFSIFLVYILYHLSFHKNLFYYTLKKFTICFCILKIVWIFIGIVIFFTYCINLEPEFLNIFINFDFILTSIFLIVTMFILIKKYNKENPMLVLPN